MGHGRCEAIMWQPRNVLAHRCEQVPLGCELTWRSNHLSLNVYLQRAPLRIAESDTECYC